MGRMPVPQPMVRIGTGCWYCIHGLLERPGLHFALLRG